MSILAKESQHLLRYDDRLFFRHVMAAVADDAALNIFTKRLHRVVNIWRASAISAEGQDRCLHLRVCKYRILLHAFEHGSIITKHAIKISKLAVDSLVFINVGLAKGARWIRGLALEKTTQ